MSECHFASIKDRYPLPCPVSSRTYYYLFTFIHINRGERWGRKRTESKKKAHPGGIKQTKTTAGIISKDVAKDKAIPLDTEHGPRPNRRAAVGAFFFHLPTGQIRLHFERKTVNSPGRAWAEKCLQPRCTFPKFCDKLPAAGRAEVRPAIRTVCYCPFLGKERKHRSTERMQCGGARPYFPLHFPVVSVCWPRIRFPLGYL